MKQDDAETGVSQGSDDTVNVSSADYVFEGVEGDCGGSQRHFRSTSVPFRCGGEERGCCGEIRFGIVLCGGDSEYRVTVGTWYGRFVTHSKSEELKREEIEIGA